METIERPPAETLEEPLPPMEWPCTAELAECTCPDFCERDHANE